LAQLLRADLLPEAWIAPAKVRQLRALLRHRISLVRLGTQLRNRIHAVAADHGCDRSASYWTGPGRGWLAELDLPSGSREIIAGYLAVTGRPGSTDRPDRRRAARPRQGRPAGQGTPDAARRRGAHHAGHGGRDRRHYPVPQCPQAGLLGRPDPGPCGARTCTYGTGTSPEQGSAWLRWALNQAAQTAKRSPDFAATYPAIAKRRGNKIATIAIARKLLTRAWHVLADMQATSTNEPLRRP
jgi:hypothetical protein